MPESALTLNYQESGKRFYQEVKMPKLKRQVSSQNQSYKKIRIAHDGIVNRKKKEMSLDNNTIELIPPKSNEIESLKNFPFLSVKSKKFGY